MASTAMGVLRVFVGVLHRDEEFQVDRNRAAAGHAPEHLPASPRAPDAGSSKTHGRATRGRDHREGCRGAADETIGQRSPAKA